MRAIPYLKEEGCDCVVTILSEKEGAVEIGKAVEMSGLSWKWIPLESGRPPEGKKNTMVIHALPQLSQQLEAGASVFIHCSAGMHRTGMVAYALLRRIGYTQEESLKLIEQMRPETFRALKKGHLQWAEQVISQEQ